MAFELEKRNVNYFICTGQEASLSNTSSLSYSHCRVPSKEGFEEIVENSVLKLGEDEARMRFIYSQSGGIIELFNELGVDFEYRSFGVIPQGKASSRNILLRRLQENIPLIETGTELVDFSYVGGRFKVYFRKGEETFYLTSNYLVLATGGYGGTFEFNDNVQYKNYNVFDIVRRNGGEVINLDCIFVHPFGYDSGRRIFIGNEIKDGEFITDKGDYVFSRDLRRLIKNNDYHEQFSVILNQINHFKKNDSKVYFENSFGKVEIVPTVHYTSGGILSDYVGRIVNCRNLFAIGECRADGSRNGGRFPGYPFTSAIVNGKFLAENVLR